MIELIPNPDIFRDVKQINRVLTVASELEGTSRCYSLHCGGIVIFKDKMYCTDQTLSDYEISNGVYIEQSTGNNEFVYYG